MFYGCRFFFCAIMDTFAPEKIWKVNYTLLGNLGGVNVTVTTVNLLEILIIYFDFISDYFCGRANFLFLQGNQLEKVIS